LDEASSLKNGFVAAFGNERGSGFATSQGDKEVEAACAVGEVAGAGFLGWVTETGQQ